MNFYILLALVYLSPLPYGVNRSWSWSLWALLIAILTISWSITAIRKTQSFTLNFRSIRDIAAAYFLVLLWIFFQTSTFAPDTWAHPVWNLMNEAFNTSLETYISLTPDDSITAMMRLISYALIFWLAFCFCQERDRARTVFYGFMLFGFIYATYGLVIEFGNFHKILWHPKSGHSLNSTFINRNHYATYAGLTLLCTIVLLSDGIKTSTYYLSGGYLGMQRFLENLITRTWFPLLAFMVIGTSLILTHSRGGFLSTALAIVVLLCALNSRRESRNLYILVLVGCLVLLGSLIFHLSSAALFTRFERLQTDGVMRAITYELTWEAIQDNPWLGFGYGSYQEAFAFYKSMGIAGTVRYPLLQNYAHNTYLETLFELGIPAASALFYCFFRLGWICLMGLWRRKRDIIYPAAGLAATVLAGSHSIVDFSMQIPAIAYTYALIMGAACAQSFSSRR